MELFASSNFPRCDYYPYLPILIRISCQCTSKGENTLFSPFVISSKLFFVHFPFVLAFSLSKSFPRIIFGRWQIGYLGANTSCHTRINRIWKRSDREKKNSFLPFRSFWSKHLFVTCNCKGDYWPIEYYFTQLSANTWSFLRQKWGFSKKSRRVYPLRELFPAQTRCVRFTIFFGHSHPSRSIFLL